MKTADCVAPSHILAFDVYTIVDYPVSDAICRLVESFVQVYAGRMTAHRRNESYFPELEGDAQRLADEWLSSYLRLVLRILQSARESYPQVAVDDSRGTGRVRTARRADPPPNLPT